LRLAWYETLLRAGFSPDIGEGSRFDQDLHLDIEIMSRSIIWHEARANRFVQKGRAV
jgi:hypothetical protein